MHAIVIAIFAPAPIHFGFVLSIATMHNGLNIKKANNGFISLLFAHSLALSLLVACSIAGPRFHIIFGIFIFNIKRGTEF